MKTIVYGVATFALLIGSAASADPGRKGGHGNNGHGNNGHGNKGRGNGQHSDNGRHAGWGQDRGNGHRWNRGEHMGYNDWNNAPRVDYRRYHLQQPPRGYEWRRQNDQFVLGAVAGGLIAAIITSASR